MHWSDGQREDPRWLGPAPMALYPLVASTTSSRFFAMARPTISSEAPALYTSAVSMKL